MHISYEFISVMEYICSYVQIKHVLVPCVVGCWRLLLLLLLRLLLPLLMPLPLLFFFSHTLMLVWKTAVCFLHICINSYYCMYPNIYNTNTYTIIIYLIVLMCCVIAHMCSFSTGNVYILSLRRMNDSIQFDSNRWYECCKCVVSGDSPFHL